MQWEIRLPKKFEIGKGPFLMPIFYRGAGIGTYWYNNDARLSGFSPKSTVAADPSLLMSHIAGGNPTSPYISLTRSWGVAWIYAVIGKTIATAANPAYVYELRIDDPLPAGLQLIDPIQELSTALPGPLQNPFYQHYGFPTFLLGVVDPRGQGHHLTALRPQPPPGGATPRTPNLTAELETLVRTLRDAEILAIGNIPASCVIQRHVVP